MALDKPYIFYQTTFMYVFLNSHVSFLLIGKEENIHLKTLKKSTKLEFNNTEAAIILPSTLFDGNFQNPEFENNKKDGGLRLSFIVYKKGKFFIPQSHAGLSFQINLQNKRRVVGRTHTSANQLKFSKA